MAIAQTAVTTSPTPPSVGVLTFDIASITVASGTSLLLVGLAFKHDTVSVTSVVFNSGAQALAQKTALGVNGRQEIWFLRNPTAGSGTITVTWTGTSTGLGVASTWTGIDTASDAAVFGTAATNSATSATSTLTVTSATGEVVTDAIAQAAASGISSITPHASQTLDGSTVNPSNYAGGVSHKAGSASTTMSWTFAASKTYGTVGIPLKPSATPTTAYRDVTARVRLYVRQYKDATLRFALRSASLKDVTARVRVRVTGYRDATARVRLWVQRYADTTARVNIALAPGQAYRDATARVRLAARAWRDTTLRVTVALPGLRDSSLRTRVNSRRWATCTVRLGLVPAVGSGQQTFVFSSTYNEANEQGLSETVTGVTDRPQYGPRNVE